MNKEQLDEIKSRVSIIGKYKEFDKAVSAMILTKDVPTTVAEVERLQKQHDALEFHLKVSSKALESESAKADKFQIALEKIYDDIGILTSQEIYRIVEDALEGTTALGGDDNGNNYNYAAD